MTSSGQSETAAFPLEGRPGEPMGHEALDCISCCEVDDQMCPASQRNCGHHCDHSWSHEHCCWCGKEWEVGDA